MTSFQLTSEAVQYSLRQLAFRLHLTDNTGTTGTGFDEQDFDVHYAPLESVTFAEGRPAVVIIPAQETAWHQVIELEPETLPWLSADKMFPTTPPANAEDRYPVLFRGAGVADDEPFATIIDRQRLVINVDIVAATFFMLSRWEETLLPESEHDEHDRFPATASVAFRQGFLDRPILDEYARVLGAWLEWLLPPYVSNGHRGEIYLSHDMDRPVRWNKPSSLGRWTRAAMDAFSPLHVRPLPARVQTLYDGVQVAFLNNGQRDPGYAATLELMQHTERNGLHSVFNFMGSLGGNKFDHGYDPREAPYRQLIEAVMQRGHEVGFHPGYSTYLNDEQFQIENERVASAAGSRVGSGRQHYLRFRVPDTWRTWEANGFTYDSTLSYADIHGFRAGTCFDYPPFDIEQNRQMDLLERPLIVMDGTLRTYQGLTPAQGHDEILKLARRCRNVGGNFTLLWHSDSLPTYELGWAVMYRSVLPELAQLWSAS